MDNLTHKPSLMEAILLNILMSKFDKIFNYIKLITSVNKSLFSDSDIQKVTDVSGVFTETKSTILLAYVSKSRIKSIIYLLNANINASGYAFIIRRIFNKYRRYI